MMRFIVFFAAALMFISPDGYAQQKSIFSPDVFNWQFYLNDRPDLIAAGIVTEQGARAHWQNFGRVECRRSHPTFDVDQYLDRYSDLKAHYGTNCVGAVNHFITYGRDEGRKGILGTYYDRRVTVGNGLITVGASTRTAGAIDSLYHNGREYINSWDHGRQMQFAWVVDGVGECNNPTEAGSSSDGIRSATSSHWVSHAETTNSFTTVSFPAFWAKTTERPECAGANQQPGHKLQKYVQVGVPNVSEHLIEILGEVTIPEATTHLRVEAPATYLTSEFTVFYNWNPVNCQVTLNTRPPEEQGLPVIATVSGGSAAIGAWSPDLPSPGFLTVGYGHARFPVPGNPAASTNKINAVFRVSNVPAGTYDYQTFVAVGTLEQVRVALCAAKNAFAN